MFVPVCAVEAEGELATGAGADDEEPAGAGLLAAVEAGAEVGAEEVGLLDDPQAVASNAQHAIAPATASGRASRSTGPRRGRSARR